jgi:hypothetical protein
LELTANSAAIWIDFTSPTFSIWPALSDGIGAAEVPLPIPKDPALAGAQAVALVAWAGSSSPFPCPPGGVSASNDLAVTLQQGAWAGS